MQRGSTVVTPSAILLLTVAHAAEVTDIPAPLRGDIHLGYSGSFEQAGIEEAGETYAIRNTLRHDVTLRTEFSPYQGIGLTVGLPITASHQISYPSARAMVFEPVNGGGSFVDGALLDDPPSFRGSGVQGVWLGAAFTPVSTRFKRSLPMNLRIDLAARTPAPNATIYGPNRGGSPGGAALRLSVAGSRRMGNAEPYSKLTWQQEFPFEAELADAAGSVIASGVRLKAASTIGFVVGTEAILAERSDDGMRVAFDVWGGLTYRGWADRGSGVHLPSVLDIGRTAPATKGEDLLARFGVGVDYHINTWVGLRFGGEGQYFTPHTIEHLYAARTDGGSFAVAWNAAIVGRIRLKDDDPTW